MSRIAVLHRFDLISVHEEAKKMKATFEREGWEADLIPYSKVAVIGSDFKAYDRAIFWTAYTHFEANSLRRFWNYRFAHRIISYYVIEGISHHMATHRSFLTDQYIVTPSIFAKECIELTGVKVKEVIPHQIDENMIIDDTFGVTWRAKYPKDKKIFTYIGNPIKRKGLLELREATDILSKKRDDFHVVIHTDNQPRLQGYKMERLQHSNITLELEFGKITKSQALAKMKYGDVHVHPAKSEGFGLEVLEALHMGKPLVCINAPAVNEIATPQNSFMTPYYEYINARYYPNIDFREVNYEPRALAEQMELALTSPKTIIEEKQMNGFETIKRFTKTYKRFLEI